MDSDEDLPLTRNTVFRTKVYCPILGSIVDGILSNDDLGQQNSERNVVFTKLKQSQYSEPRFNELPRDWANWFVISRVRYIENLVITNLLENNQSVHIGVELIINRSNKRQRRINRIRFYDSASVILYRVSRND